jgi:hypothetical protein
LANHVALTQEERLEVAAFWGEFFRNGGEGRQPTPFQLDAVNDATVRDSLLFWQIQGNPNEYNDAFPQESISLIDAFGPAPDAHSAISAMHRYMSDKNAEGVDVDDLDTGSVFVLMHLMWLSLGGDFKMAMFEASTLSKAVILHQLHSPENKYPHSSPLAGLGMAAYMLEHMGDQGKALDLAAEMFGLSTDHPNTRYARERVIERQLDRVISEEEAKNDNDKAA